MANTHRKHIRHTRYARLRRSRKFLAVLAQEAADLAATGEAIDFTAAGGDSAALTATSHGLAVGNGPYLLTTTDTLPGNFDTADLYWVATVADANTFTLTTNRNNDAEQVPAADAGTGTHTLTRAASAAAMLELMRTNHPRTVMAATDVDSLS